MTNKDDSAISVASCACSKCCFESLLLGDDNSVEEFFLNVPIGAGANAVDGGAVESRGVT